MQINYEEKLKQWIKDNFKTRTDLVRFNNKLWYKLNKYHPYILDSIYGKRKYFHNWTYDLVKKESLKYKTFSEFSKHCSSGARYALQYNLKYDLFPNTYNHTEWLELYNNKLKKNNVSKLNEQECIELGLTYNTLKDFYINNKKEYLFLKKLKLLYKISYYKKLSYKCRIIKKRKLYNYNLCKEIILKCKNITEFRKKHPGGYKYVLLNKLDGELFRHFIKINYSVKEHCKVYTIAEIQEAFLLSGGTIKKFKKEYSSKYLFALRSGILKKITAHIKRYPRWTKETAELERKKYESNNQFKKYSGGAFNFLKRLKKQNQV